MIKVLEMESSKGWGGQEKRSVRVVNSLDKKDFKVFWAVQPDSKLYQKKDEIEAIFFPVSMRKSYDLNTIFKIAKFVKKNKIDIIATHSGKDAWIGAIVGKITNTKVIRTRHLQTPISSTFSYNLSDKVVAVSKGVYQYLLDKGVKKEKLETIYTGIDTQKFNPIKKRDLKKELGLPPDTVIIGIVAVLRAAKRHIDLIKAFSQLNTKKDVALIIIGSGPQEKNIINFINTNNLKNIYLLGHKEDIDQLLPSFDIFVLPSNMEALGTAILEASACGVPCVGSNVGGIPETIIENRTGFLFEKENIYDLKDKLKILIANEQLRKEFGKNAREHIEKNFSIKNMITQTQKLYKKVLK